MTLRLLIASDAPWSTSGYANQVKQFAPRLAALGHDVALLATFGLHGAVREWEGLRVYPGGADSFANDVIGAYARDWNADIVITLKDSFVFRPEAMQGLRWCPMTPIDHEPVPPPVAQVIRASYRPIAYAPNGFRALRAMGADPLYCPHSFDPRVFHPEDKAEARKFLGIDPSLFIVGAVAVNRGGVPSRKAWPQNLEAFALFARDKPLARYFIHTDLAADGFEGGMNIQALAGQLGCADKIIFCDQERYRRGGFPEEYLLAVYNSIDVLNAVSLGEGFGIPALEAQACGTPVILSDFAAHRDLCFGGWKVSDGLRFYDGQGAWVFIPKPEAVAAAMEQAYTAYLEDRPDLPDAAFAGAQEYTLDRVVETYWKPALEELERQIEEDKGGRGVLRIIRKEEVFA